MPSAEELRAALVVAELEEELVAPKDAGGDISELKHRLREARRDYRQNYRSATPAPGDGVAQPETIAVTAGVND